MLPTPANTNSPAVTFTPAHRLDALVEHTADLDKAEVLQRSIPDWLANADLAQAQALKTAFEQAHVCHTRAREALDRLKPLDVFCKEQLTDLLKAKWTVEFDVERDTLEVSTTSITSTSMFPVDWTGTVTTQSRSLLHAAMENFTLGEAGTNGFSKESLIRINGKPQTATVITPAHFATLCRELDLGGRYQQHIDQALALPPRTLVDSAANSAASAADIRRLKLLDMQVAVHIAYMKKDISAAAHALLNSVITQDVPVASIRNALFDGVPVMWQGLMIHDVCISGALVFSNQSIDTHAQAKCIVYMPNEPRRPLYEYASLDEFKVYLTLKLQTKSYRAVFARQYLCGHDKTKFFTAFDKDKALGPLATMPATCPSDFFFSAFIEKTQQDAQVLAVPTESVDEQQREKTRKTLMEASLVLLNAASFFVPVLGELMAAAAIVDIAGEVYEGVQDWTHGQRTEALSHLLNVVENVAQMAAFVVGGKVVTSAFSRIAGEQATFFDGFEAVTGRHGEPRLWKPDLKAYKQATPPAATLRPDSNGLYKDGQRTLILMDGAPYRVSQDPATKAWRVDHPVRQDAFQPTLVRHVEGGWRHIHEHVYEWPSGYALKRLSPGQTGLSHSDIVSIGAITDLSPALVHQLHEANLPLPARIKDCIERFKLNQGINLLIRRMERGEFFGTAHLQEQLHTLPTLPGWPKERFIEVVDDKQQFVSRHPQSATVDEANRVPVSESELKSGKLLETVINGLSSKEVEGIIGATTESKPALLAQKIGTALKGNRRPLMEQLYKTYDGIATGDVATLCDQVTDLPVRVAEELFSNASGRDRSLLRERRILGLDLAQQVSEAQFAIRQDRALTGFRLPSLANDDTDNLALRFMDRLQGWDDGFRLEVRQGSSTGTLLDSVGQATAPAKGVIVKTASGYQVSQGTGTTLTTRSSERLLDSIYRALPQTQRTRMGLSGIEAQDVSRLQTRLLVATSRDPLRTARMLRNERTELAQHFSSCVQADPPAANVYAQALIRKVRKLYPYFSDAQVSSFLDAAGSTQTLRVNGIKALEQQLKQLREVLRNWCADDEQMKKLPGQLNDLRVSRRQVADAIENCWRRVAPPRWPQDQPYTALNLQRNPVGQMPTLTEQDVAHVRSLAITDMEAGDELAYFLRPFKGLVTLELDRNRLTRLPEILSHMPDLQHLSLNGNQVALTEHTLRKLADMRTLRTLSLSGNRLGATLDVSQMANLQALILSDTHATELPAGFDRLPYLNRVDLRGNQIRELPDWLFDVPQRFAQFINLRYNPLSAASRAKLQSYRDRTGIGMGFMADDAKVTSEQVARDFWMPDSREADYTRRNRTWLALKNEPASPGLFQLLAEVGNSADSRFVHEDMTRRVWNVIDATAADSALRERLLALAVKANCTDSAALIFSHLEVAVEIDKVVKASANAHDEAARLLSLGRALFCQDTLAGIAEEHARANPRLDPVEVELAYRTGLAERLELVGQPRHMRYASLSGVTQANLDTAYARVTTALLSPALLRDLSTRSFWVDFLRKHHAQRLNRLAAPFHVRMQAAFEGEATLGTRYRAHVDGIMDQLQQAETTLLEELTTQALAADETKTCFILD
ncbi:NEL-type E3 ubiquitin ligase domain-containing protein [Pseudomonas sp. Sample_10]|uniref:NEL-type E3 ubiquitin ligase domain-containing protein n=1 Tax=Pseudomonas sp. Sample_10 TaxID=2448269 RepID=UPI001036739D|nr:NEL-type E3 ubiquitin ligase domain-containing protein [Pseudomonas sp. Sample_10]